MNEVGMPYIGSDIGIVNPGGKFLDIPIKGLGVDGGFWLAMTIDRV